MNLVLLFCLCLFAASWSQEWVVADTNAAELILSDSTSPRIPMNVETDRLQSLPATKPAFETPSSAPPLRKQLSDEEQIQYDWEHFLGSFRFSLEQSPVASFVHKTKSDQKRQYRAPYILYLTPFEAIDIMPAYPSSDLSSFRDLYSFNFGFGMAMNSVISMDHQAQAPLFRSGRSQFIAGTYLSTCFFRSANPYWSAGLMGSVAFLIDKDNQLRFGLKHELFSHLTQDGSSADYYVTPNNWRMFISISFGSI